MRLMILYRGPLSSCNYGCPYCPFAKNDETADEHEFDRLALNRFVDWVTTKSNYRISILFTPWGEALIHKRYQQALSRLSHLDHIERVAIQTNLSCRLEWLQECNKERLALWTTYHPGEVNRDNFLAKCQQLSQQQIRFSVGMVGLKEYLAEIKLMRAELSKQVYLWVNAYKDLPAYYTDQDITEITAIDPFFPINLQDYASLGRDCRAGDSVISVDGDGTIRRCHFIKTPIGNIYQDDLETVLKPRQCTRQICDCHIGYVHLNELNLYQVFDQGVLERIPAGWEKD